MKFLFAACILMLTSRSPGAPNSPPGSPPAPGASPAPASPSAPSAADEAARAAHAVLNEIAAAYRNARTLTDTVVLTQEVAGKSWDTNYVVALGEGTDARISRGDETLTALGESMYITRQSVPEKYFQIPLDRNIDLSMRQIAGWGPIPVPDVALRYSAATDDPVLAFNLGNPLRLRVVSHSLIERDGRSILEIQFTGPFGPTVAQVDPQTKLIESVRATLLPKGGKSSAVKIFTVTMKPQVRDSLETPLTLDTSSRRRVTDINKLVPLIEGDVVDDAKLQTVDDRVIHLKQHRGSVVVLGFWSTWCGPCRDALPGLDQFAAWARDSGKPIVVYAVNAREMLDSAKDNPQSRQEHVKEFWSNSGFSVPLLLDLRDEFYSKFGFGEIPAATVIIGPDGKIIATQSSMLEDPADSAAVVEQLKKAALGALGTPG